MTDSLHKSKPYNTRKKFYFPSKSTFKSRHSKKRKKKPNKWIRLDNSEQCSKTEIKPKDTVCIEDPAEEDQSEVPQYIEALQLSPILKYTDLNKQSPVIGNRQDNYLIKDTDSSDSEGLEFNIEVEEQLSVTSHSIREFISQDCTNVVENYYVPTPHNEAPSKRKKQFNKNGLAHSLQAALLRQNAEVSFWKHEREFAGVVQEPSLFILVKNSFKQFGVCVLECENLNSSEHCLVVLGSTVTCDVCTIANSKIQIYEPYLIKTVKHNDNLIPCYFNVSKLINS